MLFAFSKERIDQAYKFAISTIEKQQKELEEAEAYIEEHKARQSEIVSFLESQLNSTEPKSDLLAEYLKGELQYQKAMEDDYSEALEYHTHCAALCRQRIDSLSLYIELLEPLRGEYGNA